MKRFLLTLALLLCSASVFAAGWDSAVLKSIDAQPNGSVHLGVVLTDSATGQSLFQDFFLDGASLDAAALAAAVQARVAILNGAVSKSKALSPGAGISLTPAVVTPSKPVNPTPEQVFFTDLNQLRSVALGLAAAGIDPAGVSTFADLQKKVQQEFQEAYVSDGGWPR